MELKPKGKLPNNNVGIYAVLVEFSDGSKLMACQNVDDMTAIRVYQEYITGIGARVGTTKRVSAIDNKDTVYVSWVYPGGEV